MKILELHLRNIASIVKADIDFENERGMIDPDTGKAARMFLIFGDTGTGKSVLLDGIAMALFGKTPRTEGVVNKKQNTYINESGNEVNITSIEQYTRLGITEKDDCYSEVVFVGNDGIDYRAKMQLGVSKMRNGSYKNKKKWSLKAGGQEPVEGEQCSKMIEEAIGLNFEQFNRMAMLAQGQFASFLCGGREERADILEKLTNTSIFSDYGKAIKSLFDSKKEAANLLKTAYQKADEYVISDDEEKRLEKQMTDEEAKMLAAAKNKKVLNDRINLVIKIEDNKKKHSTAAAKLEELDAESKSEEYATKKELCKDWDDTDDIRKTMSDLIANNETLGKTEKEEETLRSEFETLEADLIWREESLQERVKSTETEQKWIEERHDKDALYSEAKVICAELEQYKKEQSTLAGMKKEKEEAEKQVAPLTEALQKAEENKTLCDKTVKASEQAIEELTKQRDALEPSKLDEELRRLGKLKLALEKLKNDYNALIQKKKEHQDKTTKLGVLEEKKEEIDKALKAVTEEADKNKTEYEKSLKRFAAINASLEETLETLRNKMAEEHTDICPLCGQDIKKPLLTRDDFAALVSPYYEEQKQAKEAYDLSQRQLTEVNNTASELEGQIKTLKTNYLEDTASIEEQEKNLKPRMEIAQIAMEGDVEKAFDEKLRQNEADEQALLKKKEQVSLLQNGINAKLEEKKPQDKALAESIEALAAAKSRKEQNDNRINELVSKIEAMTLDAAQTKSKLNERVGKHFPMWAEETDGVSSRLKKESEEYLNRKESLRNAVAALTRDREQTEALRNLSKTIAGKHSEWTTPIIAKEHKSSNIAEEWNTLAARNSELGSTRKNCQVNIEQCEKELSAWRAASGKDNDYLKRLMAMRDDIAAMRQYLTEKESDRKSWTKAQDDALAEIAEGRKRLELGESDGVPDRIEMEKQRDAEELAEKAANALYTEAKTKLDSNKEYEEKSKEAKTAYEKAQKESDHWSVLNKRFGGDRFRNLVQTYILSPLLQNANIYLSQITDRYTLTCSEDNEQLSILVLDRYNRNEVRSAAVLSGGEKFMISLALSLALSSLNRPDMNVNILFIDEGFGTLDQECLSSVMSTLGKLGEMSGQGGRRVGIISHREELLGCIPNKIKLSKIGEGRSNVEVVYEP